MLKYFDDRLLDELEMKDFINNLCARMGWLQLNTIKYEVFFELTVEFYTTLKIVDEKLGIFSCRFCGKEYLFDYELMSDVFGFPEGGICQPPSNYNMSNFWAEITSRDKVCEGQVMTSGLIHSHSCLLMHKFMSYNIFGKIDSTKVSSDELFLLWCMHTNTQVCSTYFVFHSMWRVVQARKAALSMGHIVTGLAYYFASFDVTK